MLKSKLAERLLLVLLSMTFLCGHGWAQATGSIVGTVMDKSNAVIPSAKVTITNIATNQSQTALSNGAGNFQFLNLLPSTYKLVVEKEGFQKFVVPGQQVPVGVAVRVDADLTVGSTTQTVEVSTEAPLLQTQSSSLSYDVEQSQFKSLPLNGRNPLNLLTLEPGVVPQGATSGSVSVANNTGWGNYQIGGGTANQGAEYLDGAPVNISYVNSMALDPTQDTIDQVQIQTNNVSPEYGRFAGGVLLMATKSGSNQLHGALYEYVRNAALNANTWINNHKGIARPQWTQNQYGATLGGPVLKDRAFFFTSWEQFDLRQGVTTTSTMPSTNELAGIFGTTPLYNPLNATCSTTGTGSGTSPCLLPTNASGNYYIPSQYLSTTASAINSYIFKGQPTFAANNYTFQAINPTDYNNWNARGDETVGKNRLFERYTQYHLPYTGYATLGNSFFYPQVNDSRQAVIGDTIALNSSMVVDVRAAFLRYKYNRQQQLCCNFNVAGFGPGWGALAPGIHYKELPHLVFSQGYYSPGGPNIADTDNSYVLSGNFTWTKGRHTMTFGGEDRKIEWDYTQTNIPSGQFSYNASATASSTGSGGDAFASYMLGVPYQGSFQEVAISKGVIWYAGLYAGDTFRMTPKLTINAGVRWEQPGAFTETHGSLETLMVNMAQPSLPSINGQALTGGLALINSPQWPHKDWQQLHWLLFSPRVGFAYSPSQKMTISSGFGISYLPATVAFSAGPYDVPSNVGTSNMVAYVNSATAFNTMDNPFGGGGLSLPFGASQAGVNSLVGNGIQAMLPNQAYPYYMQWNLGVQRQFGSSASVQVTYVGSKGVHLPLYSINEDQLPDQYDVCGYDSTQPQCKYSGDGLQHLLTDQVANPMSTAHGGFISPSAGTLGKPTIAFGYLLKPHPQYLYMTALAPTIAGTTYNSLQVQAKKRFGSAGVLMASFAWSDLKGTADVLSPWLEANNHDVGGAQGIQDNTNINGNSTNPGEVSQSSFNVPLRLVVNYVYPLPFGHGQRFFSNANKVVNGLVGDWTVNGISTFQSGFPLAFINNGTNQLETNFAAGQAGGGTGAGANRPFFTTGCAEGVSGKPSQRISGWFNKSCFSAPSGTANDPSQWKFGNEPRVDPVLRAQGIDSSDFSVAKGISFHERYQVEVRTEFFNVFNWTQFAPPSTLADSASVFGTVSAQYNNPRLIQFSGRFTF